MNQEYSLGPDIVAVGGGMQESLAAALGPNYLIVIGVIVLLLIVIIYLLWKKSGSSEKFNPTATMLAQRVALPEAFDGEADKTDRSKSWFAFDVQSAPIGKPSQWYGPTQMSMTPEAVAWCATANNRPNNDAWAWMGQVARGERMKGNKTDSALSAIAQGY